MSKAKISGCECKVIAFEDVAIGQEFESPSHVNFDLLFAGCHLTKRSHEHYGGCDDKNYSEFDVGVDHFEDGCIVRIADCMSTQEIEPVKTLRDEFAIAVLVAIMSKPDSNHYSAEAIAMSAYHRADAMLKAREAEVDE